jgi:hypothetical protein
VNWKIMLLLVPAGAIAYWWSRQPKTVCDERPPEAPPGKAVAHVMRCRKVCPPGQVYDPTAFWGFGACVRAEEAALVQPYRLQGVTYVV